MIIIFFFNYTATTEIYTLSLHDALPISPYERPPLSKDYLRGESTADKARVHEPGFYEARAIELLTGTDVVARSEEHTSELQSRHYLVCRLLLEKKKKNKKKRHIIHTQE